MMDCNSLSHRISFYRMRICVFVYLNLAPFIYVVWKVFSSGKKNDYLINDILHSLVLLKRHLVHFPCSCLYISSLHRPDIPSNNKYSSIYFFILNAWMFDRYFSSLGCLAPHFNSFSIFFSVFVLAA